MWPEPAPRDRNALGGNGTAPPPGSSAERSWHNAAVHITSPAACTNAVTAYGWRAIGMVAMLATLGACATRSPHVTAADNTAAWSNVLDLQPGTQVRIDLHPGGQVDGRVRTVTESGVDLTAITGRRSVNRADISRITTLHRRTAQKAKRGALVAGVLGTALSVLAADSPDFDFSALVAVGWITIGAGIGASDGYFDRDEVVVYSNPMPPRPPETRH